MVEAISRPLTAALGGHANGGGDGISSYEHKNLQTSNRVALLQQKQTFATFTPPMGQQHNAEQKKQTSNAETQTIFVRKRDKGEVGVKVGNNCSCTSRSSSLFTTRQTNRQVKSATCRPHRVAANTANTCSYRPKTAGYVKQADQTGDHSGTVIEDVENDHPNELQDKWLEQDINELLHSYTWTSSTKKAYNEVDWKINNETSTMADPSIIAANLPDPVSLRFTMKRNETYPHQWQSLGSAWDNVQTRGEFKLNNALLVNLI
jgi:hypothetical protein